MHRVIIKNIIPLSPFTIRDLRERKDDAAIIAAKFGEEGVKDAIKESLLKVYLDAGYFETVEEYRMTAALSLILAAAREAKGKSRADEMLIDEALSEAGDNLPLVVNGAAREKVRSHVEEPFSSFWAPAAPEVRKAFTKMALEIFDAQREENGALAEYVFSGTDSQIEEKIKLISSLAGFEFWRDYPFLSIEHVKRLSEMNPFSREFGMILQNGHIDSESLYTFVEKRKSLAERENFARNRNLGDYVAMKIIQKDASIQVIAAVAANPSVDMDIRRYALEKVLKKQRRAGGIYENLSRALLVDTDEDLLEKIIDAIVDFLKQKVGKGGRTVALVSENMRRFARKSDSRLALIPGATIGSWVHYVNDPLQFHPLSKKIPLSEIEKTSRYQDAKTDHKIEYLFERAARGCKDSMEAAIDMIKKLEESENITKAMEEYIGTSVGRIFRAAAKVNHPAAKEMVRKRIEYLLDYPQEIGMIVSILDKMDFENEETVKIFENVQKKIPVFSLDDRGSAIALDVYVRDYPVAVLFGRVLKWSGEI